jgi:hypothetical protein
MQPRRNQFSKRIKLLSHGYIKPEAFPGGEIMVFPWDSNVDDWLLTRVKMGNRDAALFDLLGKVCDLNGCPVDSFLIGDMNTVLLVARAIRYKSMIEYQATCKCGRRTMERVSVPDDLERIGEKGPDYPGHDVITLADCQDVVALRPLQIRDERAILNRDEAVKHLMTERVQRIVTAIVSINDGRPDMWEDALRWYNALSPSDVVQLERASNDLHPHLSTTMWHRCEDCGDEFSVELDITKVEFFRPGGQPVPGTNVAAAPGSGLARQGPDSQRGGHSGPASGNNDRVG